MVSPVTAWDEPERWEALKLPEACPICARGEPLDVIAEYDTVWVTAGPKAPLPAYVCVVSKEHAVEPFELPAAMQAGFWLEAMLVARVLAELVQPTKMNYEIHGNTVPHPHMHLFPRFAGDPYVGGPIDPTKAVFTRSHEEVERLQRALQRT
jgi:diadenosine tetraphosphate (Ap4A) HIT family hydrolase